MDINKILLDNEQNDFIRVIENLNKSEKEKIALEIEKINLVECMNYLNEKAITPKEIGDIKPIKYIDSNVVNKEMFMNIGIDILRKNEYAIIILAGGQGTRLGFDGPKGIFKIFPNENTTFFSLYIEEIKKFEKKYFCKIPLYIMTSKKNNKDTIQYFEDNNYFNRKEDIHFFVQDEMPMFLENKNLIVDENKNIKFASNGHGNVFEAMKKNGVISELKNKKIKYLLITGLDNILMKPIDELPLGIMVKENVKSIGKSIKKERPEEKMGVFCRENGKVKVIEYSEISEELAQKKRGEELFLADAHLLWNIYRVDVLDELSMKKVKYHLAHKKCNYLNENGELVIPNKPNAYKFESFIFDFFDILNDMIIYRVDRNKEYAPIKNKVGIDSVESAREKYRSVRNS